MVHVHQDFYFDSEIGRSLSSVRSVHVPPPEASSGFGENLLSYLVDIEGCLFCPRYLMRKFGVVRIMDSSKTCRAAQEGGRIEVFWLELLRGR